MALDKITKELFKHVRTKLGAPIRKIQLTDEMLYDLFIMCIEDYQKEVHEWLIENQWGNLNGVDMTTTDMTYALSVRTLDYTTDYSQWFSKEVGLQQRGDKWELKKDYIELEPGKQSYVIPAEREINKVLYYTPPTSQAALFANYAGIDTGFGGGYAQMGANTTGGMTGFYMMPAFDTMLLAADMNLKNRLLRSDLTYKVTAGPNGTKIVHFLSTPGSRFSFGEYNDAATNPSMYGLSGGHVWYTYYDAKTKKQKDTCRKLDPNILLTPDQVPLDKINYEFLNEPTKTLIRQLLVAEAKITLGNIRGTFSGSLQIPDAEAVMDYAWLHSQGLDEKEKAMQGLKDRLDAMKPDVIMERDAKMAEQMNKILSYKPIGWKII